MNACVRPHRRRLRSVSLAPIVGLLLVVSAATLVNGALANAASTTPVTSRFDQLSVKAVLGGVLVRGSVLPGSGHVRGSVTLLLRKGTQGTFERAATIKLDANDRNFALLHSVAPGPWGVEISFQDPGQVVAVTSAPQQVTVSSFGAVHRVFPGRLSIRNGRVSYHGTVHAPLLPSQVQLQGLDLGPISVRKGHVAHTPARRFRVVATTAVPAGAGAVGFTLHAKLKRGERWTLMLTRSTNTKAGVDYAGLRTVRIR